MRLKRLIVEGFKSFADKTSFDFDAQLTGIVGPNGCGKSNVVDALKWVLGDQRAKSLRGDEMTDVIFKGAEGRESMQHAEVSLVLEDTESLADGTSITRELMVGRRLTRDKESHYLLDGEPVRLKDVRDRLMDTGLGVGAYSVMEQGRIDAVLSADPESRRAIFEEAAGISRFKVQKKETLRRLERTEQNLARVKDLLEERERRIRSLKIQAGKARRWQELRSRLRDHKSALAVAESAQLRSERDTAQQRLLALEEQFQSAVAELQSARDGLSELESRIRDAESGLARAAERVREAQSKREQTAHKLRTVEERERELAKDAETAAARIANLDQQQQQRSEALGLARENLVKLEARLVELGGEAEARKAALHESQRVVRELEAARERQRNAVLELMHQKTALRNRAHDAHATVRGLRGALDRVAERSRVLEVEVAQRAQQLDTTVREIEDLEQRARWLAEQEAEAVAEVGKADSSTAELLAREAVLRERAAGLRSRLEVLVGMEEHLEGFDGGAQYLLANRPAGLRGRLLDFIEMDLEFSRALEAALGTNSQALVVESRADAEAMLETLAREGKGRATLLVASEFGDRLVRASAFALPERAELLFTKVRCKAEAWPMVQWLLRGVCLVDDFADVDISRTDLCFVTRDGRLSCGPRTEGGAVEEGARGGLVVRKASIRQLEVEVAGVSEELNQIASARELAVTRAQELAVRVREAELARRSAREATDAKQAERLRLADRFVVLEEELQGLAEERADLERQRTIGLARLGDAYLGELLLRRREDSTNAAEAEASRAVSEARARAEEAMALERQLEVERASAKSTRDGEMQRISALDASLRDLADAIEELVQNRERAREGVERARGEAASLRETAGAVEVDWAEREEVRLTALDSLTELREERVGGQDLVRATEARRENLREDIGRARTSLGEVEHRRARLEERLLADTGIELRRIEGSIHGMGLLDVDLPGPHAGPDLVERLAGPPVPLAFVAAELELQRLWLLPDFDVDAARREVAGLDGQIERLGAVNVDAVKELEEEEQKLGTLEQDYVDLTEARKSLMEALRRMEAESRTLFERTFEAARENFRQIFRKLFQGGRADMFLTEGEDMLEGGIEIVAKPPGKELQSIALLSGGERSLTALAILFAVFKVKPSPFCILDEVDAALDETNVERFLRVLGDFVGPSQFCIVTHHKRTMAACDVLYGITMQKRGVSTRISVALDEVDDITEGPAYARAERPRIAGEEAIGF
ncbi:MAG: chromosome segregation protein SMC [Planctomycetota bacterium]